jgi:hypothetical protein
MVYSLHLFKKGKLQKIIKEKVYMYGEGNKFMSCNVSSTYDELKLFDDGGRYIVTYKRILSGNGKTIFKRR